MITKEYFEKEVAYIIENAIREDVGDGDHSSLACIPENARGRAKLLVKDKGVIAGVAFAKRVFEFVDKKLRVEIKIESLYRLLVHDKLISPLPEDKEDLASLKHRLVVWIMNQLPVDHPLLK